MVDLVATGVAILAVTVMVAWAPHARLGMRRLALILPMALSGCFAAPALPWLSGAGGIASVWSTVQATDKIADSLLALDAPIKRAICARHPPVSPGEKAWCANIPTSVAGLAVQWLAVTAADDIAPDP